MTDLHLDYRGIDDEFIEILKTELEKNRQIVNTIFPKLLEQEEKALQERKQKKLDKVRRKKRKRRNSCKEIVPKELMHDKRLSVTQKLRSASQNRKKLIKAKTQE